MHCMHVYMYMLNWTLFEFQQIDLAAQVDELRKLDAAERENYKNQMEDLRIKCEDKKQRVDEERKKFMEFKKQVALNAISNRSGKPVPPKVQYLKVVDGHTFKFHNAIKHSILLLTKITMVLSLY